MKKLISIAAIAAVVMSLAMLTGCNYEADDSSTDTSTVSSDSVENDASTNGGFENFAKYMEDGGYIKGKGEEMTASVIGAEYGERYTISSGGSRIYVELYEYKDTESDLAKRILGEAAEKGTFSLYNDIQTDGTAAAVSADGKYLMLYTDASTNGNNIQTKNDAVEAVTKYSS